MDGAELERRARTAYVARDFPAAIADWERAYAAYRAQRDHVGAVRMARSLACMYGTVHGDAAVMSGWMGRAKTLLGDTEDCAERGWVALNSGMFEADRAGKHALFREAIAAARRFHDGNLEFSALAYLGASLVHDDRAGIGMPMLDEALAAVAGGEVDDVFVLEEIFCQLFSACEHAHDVRRADAWIRVGDAVAQRHDLPAVSAFCHTHYGAVLTAAGRWLEADAALSQAVELWGLGKRSGLRRGALARLADLRVRQGRLEEAEQLLAGSGVDADTAYPLAAIHFGLGRAELAVDAIDQGLAGLPSDSAATGPLLALLVDVHLSRGDLGAATDAAARLGTTAEQHRSPFLTAAAARAQGRLAQAAGTGDAVDCLRIAVAGFAEADLPMELARTRLELAAALATQRPEVAVAEARTALQAFEQLGATRDVDAAAKVLRSLGVRTSTAIRGDGVLTMREAEVLELLGHGLSNPEIADRLFISRKTVEHHVANVLAKLGLRTRGEAAAYVARAAIR